MLDLTEEHLRIPIALANKYRSAARKAGIDFDDLISEGNLALVKAATLYDPSVVNEEKRHPGAFLHQRVEWALWKVLWPRGKKPKCFVEGDTLLDEDQSSIIKAVGREDTPVLEDKENEEVIISRLKGIHKAVAKLAIIENRKLPEVAKLLDLSVSRIGQIKEDIVRYLQRSLRVSESHKNVGYQPDGSETLDTWRRTRRTKKEIRQARRKACNQLRKAKGNGVKARRAMGVVAVSRWYLLDTTQEPPHAWGDWICMFDALAAVGIKMRDRYARGSDVYVSACLGWPDIPAGAAKVASVLIEEPMTVAQLRNLTGLGYHRCNNMLQLLCRSGLATSTGRDGRGVFAVYTATDKLKQTRTKTTHLKPVKGAHLPEDCRILPFTVLPKE